jgi:glycosyltransferase involved in cell wall biosynthesis
MLTVIIIAKNEAANLRICLDSVRWADEIIVLDSGSTDETIAIAKEYTDKVYSTDWPGYGIQKQRALEHATGDWVLNLDADESVSDALRQEITTAIQQNTADAYHSPILLYFYGKLLHYSWSPKHHIRLFKREGAHYSKDIVHETILLPAQAKIGRLRSGIQHHSVQDISHALQKMNVYSSYSAKMRKQKGQTPSLSKIILGTLWMFFRCYVIQGGWLEGKDGFVLAVLSAQGSFYRGIKMIYHDKEILECSKS